MDIETECKRTTGKQNDEESSENPVSLPAQNPKEQDDGEGQEQVRFEGTRQESCAGKIRPGLVKVEKKNDAKEKDDAKLSGHQTGHCWREHVTAQV
jgi:hypothetical protein